jgi:excisionase family DNA binding protein
VVNSYPSLPKRAYREAAHKLLAAAKDPSGAQRRLPSSVAIQQDAQRQLSKRTAAARTGLCRLQPDRAICEAIAPEVLYMNDKRAIPILEFCRRYGVSKTSAYAEIAAGHLRAVKVRRRTLVPIDDAEKWLAARPALRKSVSRYDA